MSNDITIEQFHRVLPKSVKGNITASMCDVINNLVDSNDMRQQYRDNLLSFTSVMKDGKFKMESYIEAVRYVSFKLIGSTNVEAYTRTFPNRYQRMVNEGMDSKTISGFVTAYNKNKLVNLIMEQTMVPVYILNADLYQKAINTQAELMIGAVSEKVRTDAANSLLTHLKVPESTKVELDINIKEDKTIEELRATTIELARQQRKMIQNGVMNVKQVAHSKLLIEDAEYKEVG